MGIKTKDKRDIYYRKAKEEGWRARSAFKLLQLDDTYGFLRGVERAVDLCAAPGSWSQVLSRRIYLPALRRRLELEGRGEESGKAPLGEGTSLPALPILVSIDLQPMAPVEGVVQLQGDITSKATIDEVVRRFDGAMADLIVSDGAPDVTGLHDLDEYVQAQLILAAVQVAQGCLKKGGTLVAKVFRGRDVALLAAQLRALFAAVDVAKPRSSRNSSVEAFVVCRGFGLEGEGGDEGAPGADAPDPAASLDAEAAPRPARAGSPEASPAALRDDLSFRQLTPFVACGDLDGLDPDRTYGLPDSYESLPPVQPPTTPAYKASLEEKKGGWPLVAGRTSFA